MTPDQPPSPTITIATGIQAYLDYLTGPPPKRRPNTIRTYDHAYRKLADFLSASQINPHTTPLPYLSDDERLKPFPKWLHEQGLSRNSIATHLAAVQKLLSFWFREELLDMSPPAYERLRAAFRETQKEASQRRLPRIPSQADLAQLIAFVHSQTPAQDEDKNKTEFDQRRHKLMHLRDVAILELLKATGIRVGELVALERGNLVYENHRLLIEETKSKDPRSLPLSDRAWDAIQTYLRARQDGARALPLYEQPLFARHDKGAGTKTKPLTERSVQKMIQTYRQAAGLEGEDQARITPHQFRHRLATDMLQATRGNLRVTQHVLGHQSPSTTARYTHLVNTDVDEAFDALDQAQKNQ